MDMLREHLRSSLWPIPLLMLCASLLLIQITRMADAQLAGTQALSVWWLHSGNGDDARNLLSTLATAIITIASLVFSITIVALSLAANQFGTRLVRTYVADRRTKLSLGFFLLTTVYCLLALRAVSQEMAAADVPHVTVTTGLVLGIACVLVLLFFLHRVASSFVADEVIRRVAEELNQAVDSLPSARGQQPEPDVSELLPSDSAHESHRLRSQREGYIQEICYEKLAEFAAREDLTLRLDVAAGDYVSRDGSIGRIYGARGSSAHICSRLEEWVVIGHMRTPVQDLAYPVRHLVDVALRALSPGINDSNTALVVIDRLRGALSRLLAKSLPTGVFRDAGGKCRLVGRRHSHAELIAAALWPIRDAASEHPRVIVALLSALEKLVEHARERAHFEAIENEARRAAEAAFTRHMPAGDRIAVQQALMRALQRLSDFEG